MSFNNDINEKEGRKFFSKIGFIFLGLTLFTILAQIIMGVILQPLPKSLTSNYDFWLLISALCTYILPIPFFLYFMGKFKKYNMEKKKLGILQFIACIIVTFALCYIGNIIGITITSIIGNFINSPITNPVNVMVGNSNVLITFLTVVILAPIFEELFFRKILIDRTIKYGGLVSIIISAVLFSLYHGNLNQFFYAFLMGAFFALIYVKTAKIEYTIILHALVNFFGSIVAVSIASLLNSGDMQHIENLTEAEIISNFHQFLPLILAFLISIFIILIIIIGVILILVYYNKVEIPNGEVSLKISALFLNGGMFCFVLYYLIMIFGSIFA